MPRQSWPCAEQPLQERLRRRILLLLEARLARHQRPDGHIPVLNDGEAEKHDWDIRQQPDYNAMPRQCCSLLTMVAIPAAGGRAAESRIEITRWGSTDVRQTTFAASPEGAVGAIRHAVLRPPLLRMQPPGSSDGEPLLEPTPYTWRGGEDRQALIDPAVNPWVPYIAAGDSHHCVRRYERVEMREDGDILEVIAEGVPEAYVPVPRWERGARALLGRATGCSHPVFRVRRLDGAHLRRSIAINTRTGTFHATTEIDGKLPAGASLHQATQKWPSETTL